jgi:GTPase SAR1 family protein
MPIQLIENKEKIKLNLPKFTVDDNPIADGELPYPLSLLDRYHAMAFIGRAGSGKTSMIVSMLQNKKPKIFRKRFENIIVIMPKSSRASLKNNIFDKNLSEDKLFNELDENIIDEIISKIEEASELGEKTLLILDDVASQLKKSTYLQTRLNHIIYNRRHLHCCLWMALQTYSSLPLTCRKNLSHAFIWKPAKKEAENLFEELFEMKKETVSEIMNEAYDKDHNYIYMSIYDQKLFKNLDFEIKYKEDDNKLI